MDTDGFPLVQNGKWLSLDSGVMIILECYLLVSRGFKDLFLTHGEKRATAATRKLLEIKLPLLLGVKDLCQIGAMPKTPH